MRVVEQAKREWCGAGQPADKFTVDASTEQRSTAEVLCQNFGPQQRQGGSSLVSQDINVLALVKGQERYVFLYDDSSRAETLRTLGRFASNPELSFTWYDAAVLSQKIRQEVAATPVRSSSRPRFKMPLATDSEEQG